MPHCFQRELRVSKAGLQGGTVLEPSLPLRRGISSGPSATAGSAAILRARLGGIVLRASGVKAGRFSQCAGNDDAQNSGVDFPVDDGLPERRYFPVGG